jgi:hypothetical protein
MKKNNSLIHDLTSSRVLLLYSHKNHLTLSLTKKSTSENQGSERRNWLYKRSLSKGDVVLIGFALIFLGFLMYRILNFMGMESTMAGNWVQLIIFVAISIGWVSTYIYRVSTMNMTYVRQLRNYEEAVLVKRFEELPRDELEELLVNLECEKESLTPVNKPPLKR